MRVLDGLPQRHSGPFKSLSMAMTDSTIVHIDYQSTSHRRGRYYSSMIRNASRRRDSNSQLSVWKTDALPLSYFCIFMCVAPPRLERGTHSLEGCCSIQLSYGVINLLAGRDSNPRWQVNAPD